MYNPSPQYARLLNRLMRKIDDRNPISAQGVEAPPLMHLPYLAPAISLAYN